MTRTLPETFTKNFHDLDSVQKMKYVNLGSTGLKVSVLGLGAACFGTHYGDYDVEEAKSVIRTSLRRGVNYIDTAPFYGEGKSEKTLGEALRGVPRGCYYVATKVGRFAADPGRAFDFSHDAVLQSVSDSLERLGLEYVDVVQVHDVEFAPSADTIIKETLPALHETVESGKARFIGITGYSLSKIREIVEKSNIKIDVVLSYCRLTLMDDTLKEYIPFFKSKSLGIIHASPLAMGLLTNSGSRDWHPGNELYKELCSKAGKYCELKNIELGRLAVHYTMSQPDIDIHLIGIPNISILEQNIDIVANSISQREQDVLDEIFKRFFKPSDKRHWENIEVEQYRKNLTALGLK